MIRMKFILCLAFYRHLDNRKRSLNQNQYTPNVEEEINYIYSKIKKEAVIKALKYAKQLN